MGIRRAKLSHYVVSWNEDVFSFGTSPFGRHFGGKSEGEKFVRVNKTFRESSLKSQFFPVLSTH